MVLQIKDNKVLYLDKAMKYTNDFEKVKHDLQAINHSVPKQQKIIYVGYDIYQEKYVRVKNSKDFIIDYMYGGYSNVNVSHSEYLGPVILLGFIGRRLNDQRIRLFIKHQNKKYLELTKDLIDDDPQMIANDFRNYLLTPKDFTLDYIKQVVFVDLNPPFNFMLPYGTDISKLYSESEEVPDDFSEVSLDILIDLLKNDFEPSNMHTATDLLDLLKSNKYMNTNYPIGQFIAKYYKDFLNFIEAKSSINISFLKVIKHDLPQEKFNSFIKTVIIAEYQQADSYSQLRSMLKVLRKLGVSGTILEEALSSVSSREVEVEVVGDLVKVQDTIAKLNQASQDFGLNWQNYLKIKK